MNEVTTVGVLGAGTMGAGIAQVAAEAGLEVLLHDPVAGATDRALDRIGGFLARKVEKGQLTDDGLAGAVGRLGTSAMLEGLAVAEMVIEAIPEDLDLKRDAFRRLDAVAVSGTILATNTSSLAVARIASATAHPSRVVGMHFFNPVPLMALVEVIPGPMTDPAVTDTVAYLARLMGKTPVVAADTPGFIVNRVQRAYYLEAFRMLEGGLAEVTAIDSAMRGIGFRLGPFELADIVGTDVNMAAGIAIFEGFFADPRYRPAQVQRRVADAGRLGRKTSAGYYDYDADGTRGPAWPALVAVSSAVPRVARLDAAQIEARILAAIVNEAASAVADGVASPESIDTAMRLATNWPEGPLAWGERIGLPSVVHSLDALHATVPDGRYRVTPLLRVLADSGRSFFSARA
jgi:3-hydroxybutyryl-CoA dehydrogenase